MSREEKKILLSRKQFITGAGVSAAGLVLLGGMGSLLSGCSKETGSGAANGAAGGNAAGNANGAGSAVTPLSWPVEYKKLDADKAAELAYNSYKAKHG